MKKRGFTLNKNLIWLLVVIAGLVYLGIAKGVLAKEEFPTKPIELISPYSAGSVTMACRALTEKLSKFLDTQVVIIEKPGVGGSLGAEYVAKSKPDGYTLFLFNSGSNGVNVAVRQVRYSNGDFEILGQFGLQVMGIVVRKDSPFKTLPELVEYAKKNPGKLKYGSSGYGTSGNFAMELFKIAAGKLQIDQVPFKGGADMNAALLGGHVDLSFWYSATAKPLIDAGRLRYLAMATEKREKDYPDVPTFAELGYPDVLIGAWYGLAAPKGVPKEVSDKLKDAIYRTFQHPDVTKVLSDLGYTPAFLNAEEFTKFVKEGEKMYRRVAKEAGIKLE